MDGVMMRNGGVYGIAVRQADGQIYAQRLTWYSLMSKTCLQKPFLRGFPILLETMINGIRALNRSVDLATNSESEKLPPWSMALSIALALFMAAGLFVLTPHLLSLVMLNFQVGGDVEGLSFHLWDGFYKCLIFICYIWLISLMPDIRRVFQYHGAEHKTIHAFESGRDVCAEYARGMSRLHPRCGTTFLLFVICISILLQAFLVPLLLFFWTPNTIIGKHILTICFKLLLVIPISAMSYELIRFASRLPSGFWGGLLKTPGLALQRLTTSEPSAAQIEVALVALAEALGSDASEHINTPNYVKIWDGSLLDIASQNN